LILRKITEIVATRCQILRLKCTKIDFSCGSVPRWESLQRSPDPLAEIKETYTSKKRGGLQRGEGNEGGGEEIGGTLVCISKFPL